MYRLAVVDALRACIFLAVASAMVRRSQGGTKRSAVHAGHRAVAVTRLQKGHLKTDMYASTRLKHLKDGVVSEAKNYSAAYTTTLKDLKGSECVGEIGVGTRALPTECGGRPGLAEVTSSGIAVRGKSTSSMSACRTREQASLRVVFDTGSTNIWMASDLCGKPCSHKDRRRYNHTESTTYSQPEVPAYLEIRFGTAMLKGPRGIDDFHVGPFTIQRQTFNLIEKEIGYSFEKLPLEGIVGLGFPSMSTGGQVPFFDNVIRQGLLEHNEFAFYVGGTVNGDDGDGGAIFWGGVDPELYEGNLIMFPVTQAHYWAVDLHELRIGDQKIKVASTATQARAPILADRRTPASQQFPKLIVDSGTTYITADARLLNIITQHLPSRDCADTAAYPNIVFTLMDVSGSLHNLDLTPQDYMSTRDDGKTCELSLMELEIPKGYGPGMVVGELFMRRYFTVFDRGPTGAPDDARIGFARARHDGAK